MTSNCREGGGVPALGRPGEHGSLHSSAAYIAKYPRPEDTKKHLYEPIVTYEHFQEADKKVRSSKESNPMEKVAVPYYR